MDYADLRFENHRSIWLVRPLSEDGHNWLLETAPDEAEFVGEAMAVEPRYTPSVVNAALGAGHTISIGEP